MALSGAGALRRGRAACNTLSFTHREGARAKDEDYGRALDTLAKLYERQGRVKEAEPLYRRAVAILEAARGSDYEGVATSQENLGGLLKSLGRLDEAEPLLKQALATKERVFGSTHPNRSEARCRCSEISTVCKGRPTWPNRCSGAPLNHKATVREIPVYFAPTASKTRTRRQSALAWVASDDTLAYLVASHGRGAKPEVRPVALYRTHHSPTGSKAAKLCTSRQRRCRTSRSPRSPSLMSALLWTRHRRGSIPRVFSRSRFLSSCMASTWTSRTHFAALRKLLMTSISMARRSSSLGRQATAIGTTLSAIFVPIKREVAADHLAEFLEKIAASTNATKIHVIAHSMGNTVLLDALDKLSGKQSNLRLAEIVMHSPDVGSNRFRQVMTAIKGIGAGETLYASTKDRALGLSGFISGEKAGATASVFPGVETIDVTAAGSSFLGFNHDIYATNPAIFNDMRLVLELGTHPPDERSVLFQPKATHGGTYWLYRPPEVGSVDKIALPAGAARLNTAAGLPVAPGSNARNLCQYRQLLCRSSRRRLTRGQREYQ